MTTALDPDTRRSGAGSPPPEPGAGVAVTRWLLGGVAFAAGVVGVAMLAWPQSTGRYFSWELRPAAVASFVGACYVASAFVFGWAATMRSWAAQRGLCVAVLGLAGPTLVITALHTEVFDFSRWQAVAWVVLFATSVTAFGTIVVVRGRPAAPAATAHRLPAPARVTLVVLAVIYGTVAAVLWLAPGAVSDHGPITAGPMGLRFIGSWAAFLALCAGYAARQRAWEAVWLLLAALVVFPLAGVLSLLVRIDDLRARPAAAVVTGLAALSIAGCQPRRRDVELVSQRRGVEQSGSSSGS